MQIRSRGRRSAAIFKGRFVLARFLLDVWCFCLVFTIWPFVTAIEGGREDYFRVVIEGFCVVLGRGTQRTTTRKGGITSVDSSSSLPR